LLSSIFHSTLLGLSSFTALLEQIFFPPTDLSSRSHTSSSETTLRTPSPVPTIAGYGRDNVFAFYEISSHDSFKGHNIVPNYTLSTSKVSKVYTDVAVSTLRKATNLDFLNIPRLWRNNKGLDLPSWAPDWGCSHLDAFRMICFSLLHLEWPEPPQEN